MKTFKPEEKAKMPWTGENIDLTEGHTGIKRFYYGVQGDRKSYNDQLNMERDLALKEADMFNQHNSSDIHNAQTFKSERDQLSHVAYNPYEYKRQTHFDADNDSEDDVLKGETMQKSAVGCTK